MARIRRVNYRMLKPGDGNYYRLHQSSPHMIEWREPDTSRRCRQFYASADEAITAKQNIFTKINRGQSIHGFNVALKTAIELYLDRKAMAPRTGIEYRRTLECYGDITGWPSSNHWNEATLRAFINSRLAGGKVAPATVNKDLRTLKAFWNWAIFEGYLPKQPFEELPKQDRTIKVIRKDRELWTPEQFQEAVAACVNDRWRLFITLLASGVGRSTTVVNIKLSDLDLDNACVRVYESKVGDMVAAPLHTKAIEMIRNYLPSRNGHEYLLVNLQPAAQSQKPTLSTFQNHVWKKIVRRADVPYVPLHHLRSCLVAWLEAAGEPIQSASKVLRHKSLQTTWQWYSNKRDQAVAKAAIDKLPL